MVFSMFCRPWQVGHEESSDLKKRNVFSALAAKSTASSKRPRSVEVHIGQAQPYRQPTNPSINARIVTIGHHHALNPPGDATGHFIRNGTHGFGHIKDLDLAVFCVSPQIRTSSPTVTESSPTSTMTWSMVMVPTTG